MQVKKQKIAPYVTDGHLQLTANFNVTWHKNWDNNQKFGHDTLYVLPLISESVVTCQTHCKWGRRAFQNGQISDLQWLVTLTLDRVILHTFMHHSSTTSYIPNFTEIEETFCGWTDGRTDRGGVDLINTARHTLNRNLTLGMKIRQC